jgi:hypothetical protein
MIRLLQWLGGVANTLGLPGLVRDTEYRSRALGATVRVRRGRLYTVITVNGMDVYFNRLSGTIDGVGSSQASDCKLAAAVQSEHSAFEPAPGS